jgi:hypothetical protein
MFFNKKVQQTTDHQQGQEQGLLVTPRHATWAVALFIIWSFFIFISGYFLGQRVVLEQFTTRLEQDSLSDKIYSSLCTLYEVDNEGEVTDSDGGNGGEGEDVGTPEEEIKPEQEVKEPVSTDVRVAQAIDAKKRVEATVPHYYAPLAGFSSAEHAYAFAHRCAQKNIKVLVKKKPSRSTKGRIHYWYQVVTQPYEDKKALAQVVDTIKRTEHIRDISIKKV